MRVRGWLGLFAVASAFGASVGSPAGSWTTYNGDFSGRRFSDLKKINADNIDSLSLAWVYRATGGNDAIFGGAIKATPVVVDGVMYFSLPDHVWAVDARSGREIWHYSWQSKGGIHIGNRGVAVYGTLALLRDSGLPPGFPEPDGREGALAPVDLRPGPVVLTRSVAPVVIEQPCVGGRERGRPGHSGLSGIARSGDGRVAVALVDGAEAGRAGIGDVAQCGCDGARRRHDVGAEHVRSGAESDVFGNGQSAAGDRGEGRAGATTCSRNPLWR